MIGTGRGNNWPGRPSWDAPAHHHRICVDFRAAVPILQFLCIPCVLINLYYRRLLSGRVLAPRAAANQGRLCRGYAVWGSLILAPSSPPTIRRRSGRRRRPVLARRGARCRCYCRSSCRPCSGACTCLAAAAGAAEPASGQAAAAAGPAARTASSCSSQDGTQAAGAARLLAHILQAPAALATGHRVRLGSR